jgi:hypothetical protein
MKRFILLAVASLLLLLVEPSQAPGANSENHFPLFPVPAEVLVVCHKAQEDASFRVLCPERLPRASVGYPSSAPNPLTARILRDGGLVGIEFGYGAPYPRGQRRNNPRRFPHLAILRGDVPVAEPPEGSTSLGDKRLAGTKGNLFQAPPYSNSRWGAYHGDHLIFTWRKRGSTYTISLHSWGREEALHLLEKSRRQPSTRNRLAVPAATRDRSAHIANPARGPLSSCGQRRRALGRRVLRGGSQDRSEAG